MKLFYLPTIIIFVLVLASCGRSQAYILVPQTWNDTQFVVEIRPGEPKKGMNEFVVIATQTDGVPGYNYIVTIKTDLNEKSSQMIQDGHSGVYRRAIELKDPLNEMLIVSIAHKKEEELRTELRYPISKHL